MAGAVSTSELEPGNAETGFVEIDPTRRYGRYAEVVGKGPFKTVYKAFDQFEGTEVAWSQVKLRDFMGGSDDLERLCSEVHMLQTINHKNIIKLYCYWVDKKLDHINFITETFTSGNLRQYRKKHKRVDLRVLKNWSRQILTGLLHLHSRDPPVIHRDIRCDNIFVNGNLGEVKIGDLGLAAMPYHAQSDQPIIGYVSPELYSEDYNELVDIYAFGMCLLELVTFEYPYQECSDATQIFRKISSGIKPDSLSKVKDPEVKRFIEKCICRAPERLPAKALLLDPFLQLNNVNCSIQHFLPSLPNNTDGNVHAHRREAKVDKAELNPDLLDAVGNQKDSKASCSNVNMDLSMTSQGFSLSGERTDANTIFLKLRISKSTGYVHHIHFPFDIKQDTSISVAIEMVSQLDLTDHEITEIAAMIDREIQSYTPEQIPGDDGSSGNEVTSPDNTRSDNHDDVTKSSLDYDPLSSNLVLERLPSGFRPHSPKGNTGVFPAQSQSNFTSQSSISLSTNHPTESHKNHNTSDLYSSLQIQQNEIKSDLYAVNLSDSSALLKMPPINLAALGDQGSEISICVPHDSDNVICADQDADNEMLLVDNDKIFMQDAERLENLTIEHEKELLELRKKHFQEIADILKELPPQFDNRSIPSCRMNISDNKIDEKINRCRDHSEESGSVSVQKESLSNIPWLKDSSRENDTDEKSPVVPTAAEFAQHQEAVDSTGEPNFL